MSTVSANTILDATGGNTATINGATPTVYNTMGKNRIINGAMEIDQRNAGLSAVTTNGSFAVDRWNNANSLGIGAFSAQQIPYSTVPPPAGFAYSVKWTVTTAEASPSSGNSHIRQPVEGYNFSDSAFGTADAKTVTVSFWCRSSVVGTHSGSLRNHNGTRSYPFSFSISSADTWTYVTKTIPGDTSGSWHVFANLNSTGVILSFNMGSESARLGTADSWASTNYIGTTGSVQLCETLNATFYITGVQLEVGSVATEFERRPYTTELALCQRYFEIVGQTPNSVLFQTYASGVTVGGGQRQTFYYKVNKRASPTLTINGSWSYSNASGLFAAGIGVDASRIEWSASGAGICFVWNNSSGDYLSISSEL